MSDRPVECSQCKRPAKIIYKEVSMESIVCTEMCPDCPVLQQRLHGAGTKEGINLSDTCCSHCGTALESVKVGGPMGCAECYVVFGDYLVEELIATGSIPTDLQKKLSSQRSQAIHIGKTPDKPLNITLSTRMASLNEALNEALKRENYEQAAWLRDQIKNLKEEKS